MGTEKTIQRINETKNWFFEKINKIDKNLGWGGKRPNLLKSERKEEITTNTMEVQVIIRDDFENLYSNKFENLEEMNRFQWSKAEPRKH
jgi:hypothetical protein